MKSVIYGYYYNISWVPRCIIRLSPVVTFDEGDHVGLFESDHAFNPFPFAWSIPPDTRKLSAIRQPIDKRQTAPQKPFNFFGIQ